MSFEVVTAKLKTCSMNRNGFTFLTAIFMVVLIGIMLGLTGQSWKMIMKREREKELLFRGSQIKEAIENWYNPKYTVQGVKRQSTIPLMDLKDLLQDTSLAKIKYLPQSYAASLDDKNPKCAPDCAKLKIYQDPITGKEWTIIKGTAPAPGPGPTGDYAVNPGAPGIIGVASRSDEEPLRTDFKDTALENMGPSGVGAVLGATKTVSPSGGVVTTTPPPSFGSKITKYSEWEFKAEPPQKNDHTKIYRAYHERW